MKKLFFHGNILLLFLFCICLGCSKKSSSGGGGGGGGGGGTTPTVNIQSMAFTPSSISVKAGTVIKWQNNDAVSHTVTSNDGTSFNMTVAPGASVNITFSTAGSFPYHCSFHPSMTGTVTVTP